MKSKLLLGTALLTAVSAFSQQPAAKVNGQVFDMGSYLSQKFQRLRNPVEATQTTQAATPDKNAEYGPEMDPKAASRSSSSKIAAPAQWQAITSSMNIYGVVVSGTKPLMYNDELHTVSFVHRKSPDYTPIPFPSSSPAESGAIVGVYTNDWGSTWDTTLIWNDDNRWARYPQGGIWNVPGSKCLFDSAHIVATGPVTSLSDSWVGSFLASKQLDTMGGPRNDNQVSPVLSATLFAANSGTSLPYGKFDFPALDFTITDDGMVRSLGIWANNYNGTTNAAFGFRGAAVVTGTFISGSFAWESDSIAPDVFANTSGDPYISSTSHMAWNESGTVGYVWFIGVRDTTGLPDSLAHGSNLGWQPIIFKTTNSGATWTEMPRINFNTSTGAFDEMFRRMFAIRGDSFAVPYFNMGEGIDGVVDRNDRLHIVSSIFSSSTNHPDSLSYVYTFNNADGERYFYAHQPGQRPFIYDFTETGNGWKVTLIDSMSSEAPGTTTGTDGYGDNPWDPSGGGNGTDKVESNARIQVSRTPDGRYIVYTYAESDTGLTFLSHKWNSRPNVKARMAEVGVETSTSVPAPLTVHPMEINVTDPSNISLPPYTINNSVKDKASMHYTAKKAAIISPSAAAPNVAIGLPITVSNSTGFKQYTANNHWYLSANLNFGNVSSVDWPVNECLSPKDTTGQVDTTISIVEISNNIRSSSLFPNPTNSTVKLNINLTNGSDVFIDVINTMGQVVTSARHTGAAGANSIDLNVSGLASGVYMVNIKVDEATGTKRLLIQH